MLSGPPWKPLVGQNGRTTPPLVESERNLKCSEGVKYNTYFSYVMDIHWVRMLSFQQEKQYYICYVKTFSFLPDVRSIWVKGGQGAVAGCWNLLCLQVWRTARPLRCFTLLPTRHMCFPRLLCSTVSWFMFTFSRNPQKWEHSHNFS